MAMVYYKFGHYYHVFFSFIVLNFFYIIEIVFFFSNVTFGVLSQPKWIIHILFESKQFKRYACIMIGLTWISIILCHVISIIHYHCFLLHVNVFYTITWWHSILIHVVYCLYWNVRNKGMEVNKQYSCLSSMIDNDSSVN